MTIKVLKARQVYDCFGVPTLEVEVRNEKDTAIASVPGGTSTSEREAVELRDNEMRQWHGKGVLKAVDKVNSIIAPLFVGREIDETNQAFVDRLLLDTDRTPDKSRLGANSIAAVSMAMARLGAMKDNSPLYQHIRNLAKGDNEASEYALPVPIVPVIGGGLDSGSQLFMQEIMLVPSDYASFSEAFKAVTEVYQQIKFLISKNYGLQYTSVGLKGTFAPPVKSEIEALELVKKAIERAMCTGFIKVAINANASACFKNGYYDVDIGSAFPSPERSLDSTKLGELYRQLLINYSVVSIEDPFHYEDYNAWRSFSEKTSIQIVGGKFLASNPSLVRKAIEKRSCNCLTLKIGQLGTVTEAIDLFNVVKEAGWSCIITDRKNETEDNFMADFAVGLNACQIRCGAPCRYERLSKYNQIIRIEEKLGGFGIYAGHNYRKLNRD